MDERRKQSIISDLARGHCLFDDLPLPQGLLEVILEWQRLAWFSVEGSNFKYVHNIGVKPGDPTADVLFAFCLPLLPPEITFSCKAGQAIGNGPIEGKGHRSY